MVRKHLADRYGITPEIRDEMFSRQGGRCAICRDGFGAKGPYIDHDHKIGKVRELLCSNCNFMIGLSGEDEETLYAAAWYLFKHHG